MAWFFDFKFFFQVLACEYVSFQAVTFGLYLKLRKEEIRVSSAIFLRLSYGCLG